MKRRQAQGLTDEKNLSTKQCQAEKDPRLSGADGDARGPQGLEATQGQGPKEVDRSYAAEAGSELTGGWLSSRRKESFPKAARLTKRSEFRDLSRKARRVHTPHFIVLSSTQERSASRLGITVSSKVGKAVARNRIKRVVREFFRRYRHQLARRDYVIIAKREAVGVTAEQAAAELLAALGAARERT
jgi:ribonuclease P protein component